MNITRRDLLKAATAVAAAMGIKAAGFPDAEVLAKTGGLKVVWLQAQSCSGCSVSLLNSIYYDTIEGLVLNTLDLKFHPTVMAAAGSTAVRAAEAARLAGGYVLVVEGSVPTGAAGEYCYLWPGVRAVDGVKAYARNAIYIVAVGTCAAYGGIPAGTPNVTGAKGLRDILTGKTVVNLPGCPTHPDWIVGTIAYILANGHAPTLDSSGRPTDYYGRLVHDNCPNLAAYTSNYRSRAEGGHAGGQSCLACHRNNDSDVRSPRQLGQAGCLYPVGCKGRFTYADCPARKWNGGAPGTPGVNWCIGARAPCHGCTQPNFPDGMSPFFTLNGPGA
jgi:NiFe hydrogenase small subunit HydA